MLMGICSELKAMKNLRKVTSDQVLMWARQVEAWRTKTGVRSKLEGNEQVDTTQPEKEKSQTSICRYCGSTHPPKKISSIWKEMWEVCQDEPLECIMQICETQSSQARQIHLRRWAN